ncbi:translation initiation factor IF-2 [archaeon]|jgi:translation initiation factor 5B|nr:translation initiation factor IF-2 [archaeon]
MEKQIRQPIVTVAGHVDHGKTSILDAIRGTKIQEGEAGGITQKISFTKMPQDVIQKRAGSVLEKFKIPLEIPGFLFIDTPGHAAFTNLRKRGGSLADIVVLVIDINDGIKPQTAEVLQLLKANKTPFIIALNKMDNISGWKTSENLLSFESVENQALNVKTTFEERYYTLVGALNAYGFNPELYYKVTDFTKNIAVVPCSAITGEGINEILAMISALSQKYLGDKIALSNTCRGVVLEVKKEKAMNFMECIIYDGKLSTQDEIAIASFDDVITTGIRNISEAKPLNKGYESKENVTAATGVKLQIITKEEVLPGMPFQVIKDNLEEIKESFSKEIGEEITLDYDGIMVKADSLGSLEALLVLLREKNIEVVKAGIGPITKKDLYTANALSDEHKIILGFNVSLAEDLEELRASSHDLDEIKILTDDVVYKLIDNYSEWRENKEREIERRRLNALPKICKLTVLDFCFRNSNPAVFGVVVKGGLLKKELKFINSSDEKVGLIREIQHERKNVREATMGQEVAISMPGVNFERQIKVGESLYTNLGESQFRMFKENKDLLTSDEKSVLQEIAQIKRRENVTWGV